MRCFERTHKTMLRYLGWSEEYKKELEMYIKIYHQSDERERGVVALAEKLIKADKDIVICVKTTGVSTERDEILQLTILDTDGNTVYNSLFKPEAHFQWKYAADINGITPEMVNAAPTIAEKMPEINEILLSARSIICFNSGRTIGYLRGACCVWRSDYDLIDIQEEYENLLWEAQTDCIGFPIDEKMQELDRLYGDEWGCNRASDNIEYCRKVLSLYKLIKEKGDKKDG